VSPSLTAQCNFYSAASNTAGLVTMVVQRLKDARALRGSGSGGGSGGAGAGDAPRS
jgi:hypothetical protein